MKLTSFDIAVKWVKLPTTVFFSSIYTFKEIFLRMGWGIGISLEKLGKHQLVIYNDVLLSKTNR